MKIRRNKLKLVNRVLARTYFRPRTWHNLVLGAVLACNSCLLARTRVVEFRRRTGKSFLPVMEPAISLVTFVITRDISRSNWLEIADLDRRQGRSSDGVNKSGDYCGGDAIDDRFFFFVDEDHGMSFCLIHIDVQICRIKFYM